MKKNNRAYKKLPSYEPKSTVWQNIQKRLDETENDQQLNSVFEKLPEYKAPDKIWNVIEQKFQSKKNKKIHLFVLKIAASIILLIGLGYGLNNLIENEEYTITYSIQTESNMTSDGMHNFSKGNYDIHKILAKNCNSMPEKCDGEEYKDLEKRLTHLEIDEQYLRKQLEIYKDKHIQNCLNKITNEKLKIEKFMLNMFFKN